MLGGLRRAAVRVEGHPTQRAAGRGEEGGAEGVGCVVHHQNLPAVCALGREEAAVVRQPLHKLHDRLLLRPPVRRGAEEMDDRVRLLIDSSE
eukprot:CAMPEP_0181332174 /NCGR_PEP_ID=MMETSP1101-20121128/24935_1 /TAXON_ID=46948 /ORGANISM="Rhodomonas abbreviata, Strain Caron Lab Isolate" /LENGTH=91 /DNA_ID=CAMNT_0023441765 /DNA_START=37 /DNA_END=309 /DNA_ORIENTATION=-